MIFFYLLFLGLILFLFLFTLLIWSIKSGQWDDLVTPGERVLWEDENEK